MALTNSLSPEVDTVFLMPDEEFTFISASLVKEIAYWDGDLTSFAENVAFALKKNFRNNTPFSCKISLVHSFTFQPSIIDSISLLHHDLTTQKTYSLLLH